MTRIIVIRHGNTFRDDETPRRIGAPTDLPLIAKGIEQARALGRYWRRRGVDPAPILAAPLRRTRETALLFAEQFEISPTIETANWLTEIDHGPDENASEESVIARIGRDALDAWDRDAVPPPGWRINVDGRIGAWRGFLAGCDRDTVLVTSNGAARFALLTLPGPPRSQSLKLRTGAFGVIEKQAKGGAWRLAEWDVRP